MYTGRGIAAINLEVTRIVAFFFLFPTLQHVKTSDADATLACLSSLK